MIKKIKEYKTIILNLLKLSLPILSGNISQVLISFADSIAAGRYSTLALGAISVATAIIMTVTIGSIGILLSISPVVANYRGRKEPAKKYFKLILLFSILISIPFFLILELFLKYIGVFGFEAELEHLVSQYIGICAWTIFPVSLFIAMKEFMQAYEKVVFANFLTFFMVIVNIILNVVLTFGFNCPLFQIPSMGIVGISIATLISKTLVAVIMAFYCLSLFKQPFEKSKNFVKELIRVGIPISGAMFFEFLGFNLTAVLIGKFSALYAAVHDIILCIANFTFMIVLSVSNAASIKIGYYNGAKEKGNIIKYSTANIVLVIFVCIVTFNILYFASDNIVSLFTKDNEVIYWCNKIMKIVMLFLFFDGIQGACVGILKGLKDTKMIMYTMFFSYMFIAIPLGTYLAFAHNIVLEGYWAALALSILTVAIITSIRAIKDIKNINYN